MTSQLPDKQFQRTALDILPGHLWQVAAAELPRQAS